MAIDTIRVAVSSDQAVDLRALPGVEDGTRYTVENVERVVWKQRKVGWVRKQVRWVRERCSGGEG